MGPDWAQDVQQAFQTDANLTNRILDAANRYQGDLPKLFGDIARYTLTVAQTAPSTSSPSLVTNSKKRKLDDGATTTSNGDHAGAGIAQPVVSFECNDVSFQIPARKKLKLQVVSDAQDARKQELRLLNPQTAEIEYVMSSMEIDQVFCLPVPEKQQRQWNFCVFPLSTAADDVSAKEQVVFTMAETKIAGAGVIGHTADEKDTYVMYTQAELDRMLQPYGKKVVTPYILEFHSRIVQPHRRGEHAYHVKAHRGSKEGYLFFLSNGIVFGFKKPLSFFPFSAIESISYTSVLQRTFNLVIEDVDGEGNNSRETEFSMLDQADFAGIDDYVKRHGLNDTSMAAQRRAKEYNVNKEIKKADANGEAAPTNEAGVVDDDGQTELQKAEQQLQDEEDELEEDYEASGGESDGEGEYSEEEDGNGEGYEEGEEGGVEEAEYDEEEGDE